LQARLEPIGIEPLAKLYSNGWLLVLPASIHLTRVEVNGSDKHSSLLQCSNNYGRKKIFNIDHWILGLTHKFSNSLKILDWDKHGSLFCSSVSNRGKRFLDIDTRMWKGPEPCLIRAISGENETGRSAKVCESLGVPKPARKVKLKLRV